MTTYEKLMNLKLTETGNLPHIFNEKTLETEFHPPLEIPTAPAGVNDEAWKYLHKGFRQTHTNIRYQLQAWEDTDVRKTVFQMTEEERLQWVAELVQTWEADAEEERKTERDLAWERDYYAGGNGAGLDPFAYDASGHDTGLRMRDFI